MPPRAAESQIVNDRVADALPDAPDFRDWTYRPSLEGLAPVIDARTAPWWSSDRVRDQKNEPSCTGHALAAAIDHLLARRALVTADDGNGSISKKQLLKPHASAVMLYGNAKLHDEWHGEAYGGSSLRGAIKGFHHNGVCSIETAKAVTLKSENGSDEWRWHTNAQVLDDARKTLPGAYYRVRPNLSDVHAAINEAGLVVTSGRIHNGWFDPTIEGRIPYDATGAARPGRSKHELFHAFLIVGYDNDGFLVQNSWGTGWGEQGLAWWSYADWAHNVYDAWALRLALSTPEAFKYSIGLQGIHRAAGGRNGDSPESGASPPPARLDVLGHLIPIQDGALQRHGRYQHDRETLLETFDIIVRRNSPDREAKTGQRMMSSPKKRDAEDFRYRHVLFYVLGGSRDEIDAARMVRSLTPCFKANGIYPIYFLWEATLFAQLRRQVDMVIDEVDTGAVGPRDIRSELQARLIETRVADFPNRLRREVDRAAQRFFFVRKLQKDKSTWRREPAEGTLLVNKLLEMLGPRYRAGSLSYHLAAHGPGARLVAEFLSHFDLVEAKQKPIISTINLIAPLIDRHQFDDAIGTRLTALGDGQISRRARADEALVEKVNLWHLDDAAESADLFHEGYPRSWPELWARALPIARRGDDDNNAGLEPSEDKKTGTKLLMSSQLALQRYAAALSEDAGAKALPFSRTAIKIDETDRTTARHAMLDVHPEVLDEMLKSIVGHGNVKARFRPT